MIPGLLVRELLAAFLGGGDYHRRGKGIEFGTGPRHRRRGGLFSTEEDRFKDFMGTEGMAPPSAHQGELDSDVGNLMGAGPAETPAIIDFPEKGANRTSPTIPPPLPTEEEEQDQWFVEVPSREVADTFAGKALFAMIAAAHADGALSGPERKMIEGRLTSLPPEEEEYIRHELEAPRPIESFADKNDPIDERRTIFALAVAALKADGKVAPSENRFAGKLASALGLTKQEAESIIRSISQERSKGE